MKQCKKCWGVKPCSHFHIRGRSKDGLSDWCKLCVKEYDQQRYQLNKERVILYPSQQPAEKSIAFKCWYEKNRKQRKEYKAGWREKNIEKHRGSRRKRAQERRDGDTQFRLAGNLRSRLCVAVKNNQKAGSAIKDLGCSIVEFKLYIESLWFEGMIWGNYGQWHIDHILPLASFDLTDREQFLKACHYTNLQPLWAEDNYCKGSKVI